MGISSKRRPGGNPVRTKSGNRVKEKRYDDSRDRRSRLSRGGRSNSPSPKDYVSKRKRFLDPTTLTQGMTSRCLGARLPLTALCGEEIEKDLRHMEAYSNACTAYAQQFFIYHNRASVQSGHYGPVTAPTVVSSEQYVNSEAYDPFRRSMPVRIDPEEDKRVSLLRKRIATSEAQREVLETEYMSLRAHYVHESQRLCNARSAVDGQVKVLQDLVKARGTVVALRRVRCAVARDIYKALEYRNEVLVGGEENATLKNGESEGPDLLDMWNEIESKLNQAEEACVAISIPEDLSLTQNSKGKKKKDKKQLQAGDERVVPWDCRKMPGTPEDVPSLLSQMSSNPERTAAWSCGAAFGSNEASMCWMPSCLPKSTDKMSQEYNDLLRLRKEASFLQKELDKVRTANKDLQHDIIRKRLRNDEMCAMMTLLRSETEAVLERHNVLLETQEAKAAAQDLHDRAVEEREKRAEALADIVNEEISEKPDSAKLQSPHKGGIRDPIHREEHDENDGDDEGEVDDDDEDKEINDAPPNEVVINKNDEDETEEAI
mmetsp:Transcript_19999/g.30059  ORF Transcript_19999/g.30059 Transcript_19999/m.30059 type:complete len:545 (+) Transcript_19999:96-1730(+)|eukprot:CAMPEP_0178915604 /NCGR_PEP_ID=MMETSP0786-20121207/12115_1 /TAXON_ID=186022 /ORGANISM="Thalassionema frauenfeldii, Strain CCMP 1798" /LENGTH=544 /DNA_ID=CAMNT_0020588725 /DNA_START=76 /DNA_END=1710 /DNA_ORIENTATION=-